MDARGITTGMTLTLNGADVEIHAGTLAELVAQQRLDGVRIATALNGHFVAESQRATTRLNAGDRVEIVSPRQGG